MPWPNWFHLTTTTTTTNAHAFQHLFYGIVIGLSLSIASSSLLSAYRNQTQWRRTITQGPEGKEGGKKENEKEESGEAGGLWARKNDVLRGVDGLIGAKGEIASLSKGGTADLTRGREQGIRR